MNVYNRWIAMGCIVGLAIACVVVEAALWTFLLILEVTR